jgi:integrase
MLRVKTRFIGVYCRFAKKRFGSDNKPDVCYDILYRRDGKQRFEKVGWKSEGYTELDAVKLRHKRIKSLRHPELPNVKSGRIKTIYVGVYKRYSKDRVRADGKPDICYDIHYKCNDKYIWEKVGWESEGYVVHDAVIVRGWRIRNARHPELQFQRLMPAEANATEAPPAAQSSITVADAWSAYKKHWGPNIKNFEVDECVYRKHLEPRFGQKPFTQITPVELEKFKIDLLEKNLASGSGKNILVLMRRIFNKCQEFNLIPENVRMPKLNMTREMKTDKKRERYLEPEEISKLLDCLQLISCNLYFIAKISLYTGMRLAEVLALRAHDFNLEAGIIHVQKSKTGDRTAYIPDELRRELKKLLGNPEKIHKNYIFCDEDKDSNDYSKIFSKIMTDIGLNKNASDRLHRATFHTLRHTFCSWLAINGVPIFTISKLAGHKSIDMTLRYAKLSPNVMKVALDNIQKTLSVG